MIVDRGPILKRELNGMNKTWFLNSAGELMVFDGHLPLNNETEIEEAINNQMELRTSDDEEIEEFFAKLGIPFMGMLFDTIGHF